MRAPILWLLVSHMSKRCVNWLTKYAAPARFFSSQQWFWNYSTQPEPNLGGLTPNLWQGRILGGGSGVNAMLYCRGSASVFDEWAELSGNPGLTWEALLEDFKETTHYTSDPAE